jgi:hypothetical protein
VEPVDVLRRALQAVEGAGIPDDLRALAFTTAVDLVVTGRGAAARAPAPARASAPAAVPAPAAPVPDRVARPVPVAPAPPEVHSPPVDGWDRIAAELGVRPELLDRIWDEHAGQLHLTGDVTRLGRTRAERVGNAALLLLAGLRWSGRDEGAPVPDAVVRAEVERLGLLDTGNYTKHLAARRALLAITGSGRTATYKLRYDGAEEARRLARALLEES